jgi:hypothetical protein
VRVVAHGGTVCRQDPGNFTGRRSGPNPPPDSKGSNSSKAWPSKPDQYLVKLEAEYRAEELKARIRAAELMLQGITYSQVVGVVPPQVLAQVAPRSSSSTSQQQQSRTALTHDGAIAILEDAIGRLQILPQQETSKTASKRRYSHWGGQEGDKKEFE